LAWVRDRAERGHSFSTLFEGDREERGIGKNRDTTRKVILAHTGGDCSEKPQNLKWVERGKIWGGNRGEKSHEE